MTGAGELAEGNWEWRRVMAVAEGVEVPMLCCPEDVEPCGAKHPQGRICANCRIPVCSDCERLLRQARGIPMALGNDNMWGYVTSLIARYKVRWIEMAAVIPCWTSMIVYYVEGDHGHTMTEHVGKASYRTAVRGHCYSFIMPWEDIVRSMNACTTDGDLDIFTSGGRLSKVPLTFAS